MSEFILGAGATFENSLLFQLIETNNVRPWVVSRYSEFQELTNIIEAVTGGTPVKTQSGARNMKLPYLPQLAAYGVIKTGGRTSLSSTILKLEWTDSAYDGFINDRLVESSNGTFALVKDHGKGFVVVELVYSASGSTTFQAGDFAAGTQASDVQDVSAGVTGSKQTVLYVPLEEYNTIGQQRYSLQLTREDVSRRTVVEINGQPYWQHASQALWMKESKNAMNKGIWKSPRINESNKWVSGGVKWQIENQGGTRETYNGDFTEQVLIDVAKNAREKGLNTEEYLVPCGYNVLAGMNKFVGSKYIQYAGTENTIGGKTIEGINVDTFKCLGIKFKLMPWSMLNNRAVNPEGNSALTGELKSSYTAVFLDTSPVDTVAYGTQPFVSTYYYGQDAQYMAIVEGMTDILGRKAKNPTNTVNACSIELEVNELQQLNDPSRHLLLEISQ